MQEKLEVTRSEAPGLPPVLPWGWLCLFQPLGAPPAG